MKISFIISVQRLCAFKVKTLISSPDFLINRHFHITLQNDDLVLSMDRVDCSVRSSGFPHPSEQRLKRWGAPLGAPMLLHPVSISGDIVGGYRATSLFDCYVQVFLRDRCLELRPLYFTYLLRRFASYLATHCHHRCIPEMYKYDNVRLAHSLLTMLTMVIKE